MAKLFLFFCGVLRKMHFTAPVSPRSLLIMPSFSFPIAVMMATFRISFYWVNAFPPTLRPRNFFSHDARFCHHCEFLLLRYDHLKKLRCSETDSGILCKQASHPLDRGKTSLFGFGQTSAAHTRTALVLPEKLQNSIPVAPKSTGLAENRCRIASMCCSRLFSFSKF